MYPDQIVTPDIDSGLPTFTVIKNPASAALAIEAIKNTQGDVHGLDFETTALRPDIGDVRITSISGPAGHFVFDHFYCGAFSEYADDLAEVCDWAVFNAGFEGRWFDYETGPAVTLLDVGVMSKAKLGGRPLSLAKQTERDLNKVRTNKELQVSDWSAHDLTDEQYIYAFEDAYDTYRLFDMWDADLTDEQYNGFLIMNDCWRGVVDMEDTGFTVDVNHHRMLIDMWERQRAVAERTLRKYTPTEVIPNLRSKKQLSEFIKSTLDPSSVAAWPQTDKTHQLQTTRAILRQMSFRVPYPFSRWLAALMVFNRADKYISTYGEKILTAQKLAGRVHVRYNIAQAVTCRFSSSGAMNAQNIPRKALVRKSFIAPKGTKMVLADYSGIELRVLAEVSGDEQLKEDVIFGNVHAESAITIFGYDRTVFYHALKLGEGWAKEARSKAKSFSFQLTYGAGVSALALVLRCDDEEAAAFVERWAARYPKAYAFRHKMFEQMEATGFLPVQSGRTIYVTKKNRTLPVASNYPIQGAAADVMYAAITGFEQHMNSVYAEQEVPCSMLATVHDELLLLTTPEHAEGMEHDLVRIMTDGWLKVFPDTATDNLVESAYGDNWAAKP